MPNLPPHASFVTKNRGGLFRELKSVVYITPAFEPSKEPIPAGKKYNAIWDTGASCSVITKKVVDDLSLKSIGIIEVSTANDKRMSNVYIISMGLPNKVGFPWLRVTEGGLSNIDVLVGMDIISQGDFAVSSYNGNTAFTYRHPSCECIDFVQQTNDSKIYRAPITPGRNSPCSCGSGNKYKHCCGKGK